MKKIENLKTGDLGVHTLRIWKNFFGRIGKLHQFTYTAKYAQNGAK